MKRIPLNNNIYGSIGLYRFFIIGFLIFIFGWIISWFFRFGKKKKIAKVVFILTIILSLGVPFFCTFWVFLESRSNDISYDIVIHTNRSDEYSLILPIYNNPKLHSELVIVSGNADLEIVSTDRIDIANRSSNIGLRINGSGNVTITGSIEDDDNPHMSLECRDRERYYLFWVHCEKSQGQNITLDFTSRVMFSESDEGWTNKEIKEDWISGIENGWNKYPLRRH